MAKFNELIEIPCDVCGTPFKRRRFQVEANIRRERRNMCSTECKYKHDGNLLRAKWNDGNTDDLTPFRYLYTCIKVNSKRTPDKFTGELTHLDIKEKWDKQKGKCAYTGLPMILKRDNPKNKLFQASLDRIDSSKPYRKDNIELVCLGINYMKNKFTKREAKEFLKAIMKAE